MNGWKGKALFFVLAGCQVMLRDHIRTVLLVTPIQRNRESLCIGAASVNQHAWHARSHRIVRRQQHTYTSRSLHVTHVLCCPDRGITILVSSQNGLLVRQNKLLPS